MIRLGLFLITLAIVQSVPLAATAYSTKTRYDWEGRWGTKRVPSWLMSEFPDFWDLLLNTPSIDDEGVDGWLRSFSHTTPERMRGFVEWMRAERSEAIRTGKFVGNQKQIVDSESNVRFSYNPRVWVVEKVHLMDVPTRWVENTKQQLYNYGLRADSVALAKKQVLTEMRDMLEKNTSPHPGRQVTAGEGVAVGRPPASPNWFLTAESRVRLNDRIELYQNEIKVLACLVQSRSNPERFYVVMVVGRTPQFDDSKEGLRDLFSSITN